MSVTPFPLFYEVRGAGSVKANGEYRYAGMTNSRPHYCKEDGTALWYFTTRLPPLSYWSGWFISKYVGTNSTSASDDFYAAYTHGELPPSTGWVAILPGISPTAGCGCNPPPSHVGIPIHTEHLPVVDTVDANIRAAEKGCSPHFHSRIVVQGAGSITANGIYAFKGECAHRPYYTKDDGTALWYFDNCPLHGASGGAVSYKGWYISRSLGTSSYSAAEDMYCVYSKSIDVPGCEVEAEPHVSPVNWVVRSKGMGPLAGCGEDPAPSVLPYTPAESDDVGIVPRLVMLLKLLLSDGQVVSVPVSERDSVMNLLLTLNLMLAVPYHRILLFNRGNLISDLRRLDRLVFECGICSGDLLSVEVAPNEFTTAVNWDNRHDSIQISSLYNSFVTERFRRVVVVGAGPVGLWICAQLKILRPHWSISCYEKRDQYQRSHALRLDMAAFDGVVGWIPGRSGAAELKLLRETWVPRSRTSVVEGDLRRLCSTLGVKMFYDTAVASLGELALKEGLDGSSDVIICCDGAKSSCRCELTKSTSPAAKEFKCNKQLGSLLQIKFDANGEVCSSRGVLATFLRNLPAQNEFFNILSGNFDPTSCSTPVTVFALLNEGIVESVMAASSGTKQQTTGHVPGQGSTGIFGGEEQSKEHAAEDRTVYSDLSAVLASICPAGIVEGSMAVSVLPIAYSVTAIARGIVSYENGSQLAGGISVALAGDAAMGLPLEKGLNYGWRIASTLCAYITGCEDIAHGLLAYDKYFDMISTQAIDDVHKDYDHYVKSIAVATSVRSLLRPFLRMGVTSEGHNLVNF